ncbi:hypothetical protein HDV05_007317, partial [Chytridiales sp. JEL 0842]
MASHVLDILLAEHTSTATKLSPYKPHGKNTDLDSAFAHISLTEVDDRITEFQEDELVKEALAKVQVNCTLYKVTPTKPPKTMQGLDLREYAKHIEKSLQEVEKAHVDDYVQQGPAFNDLKSQIQSCDSLLESMGNLLCGFQEDLGKISVEIEYLQSQSQSLQLKLKNRIGSHNNLNTALEGIVLGPDLIKKICEGEVNEFFLQHLQELNRKMTYVKSQKGSHIRALKDVGPEMERLRLKSAEKIREFLLRKIESLKAPNTNIAIIQQNVLLKFKELYWFLLERYGEAALEVRAIYINTVSTYFYASFEKYVKSMQNLQTVIADKLDLIGMEERAKRGGLFTSKTAIKDKANVYALGDRIQVLLSSDTGIILSHIAEDQNLKFPYEAIFKSINRLLMDNASSEYIFSTDFFVAPTKKVLRGIDGEPIQIGSVFSEVFEPTLRMLETTFKNYVDNSFDAVGILICIRLNSHHIRIMQKRRIPCLENFMNSLTMLLWPRLQMIIDLHIDSLKKATLSKLQIARDAHPHY